MAVLYQDWRFLPVSGCYFFQIHKYAAMFLINGPNKWEKEED